VIPENKFSVIIPLSPREKLNKNIKKFKKINPYKKMG